VTDDRPGIARGAALATLLGSVVAFVVLSAILVPWDWLPGGGSLPTVRPEEVFSAAEIERAEDFARVVRGLSWANLALSLAVSLILGLTPLGARLAERMPRPLRLPLTVLALLVIGRLATLPLSLLIRRERLDAGLTRQSLGGWLQDSLTNLAVTWVVTTIGLAMMVWLARRSPRSWFAWAGIATAALVFALSFLYPVVVQPLFNRFTPMADGPLRQSILQLADEEGVPVDDVLVADASRRTTTLNAYVSGYGGTRRVVVYDNLLDGLPADEARIVVAHELAHAKHNDVLVGTTLAAVGAIAAVALLALLLDGPGLRRRAGVDGPADPRVAALVLALVAVGTVLVSPVQNSASRAIEARADRVALETTRDEAGFEAMQRQLAVTSLSDPTPPAWAQFWFGSHPTTLQRIALARAVLG
jgi:STE24 endopeptidase